jgi:hypothetical protein
METATRKIPPAPLEPPNETVRVADGFCEAGNLSR